MNNKTKKILVVDDDKDIQELLNYNLEQGGFEVKLASNGKEAVNIAKEFHPDLILMDIVMPVMDGIEACRQIRENEKTKNTIIVFISGRTEEYSEIAAFQSGANDYLIKPFRMRALIERISCYINRSEAFANKNPSRITINNLFIDKEKHTVLKDSQKINLAKKEFELLYLFCEHPNKVFSRETLFREIWGLSDYSFSRTVDVHIRKLRRKVGLDSIRTVKGVGYKMEIDSPN